MDQFRFQLLKAGQAEREPVKDREEDGGRRDVGIEPGIGQCGRGVAEIEDLVQIAGKGGEFVNRHILLSHKCKMEPPDSISALAPGIRYPLGLLLRC